jgi:hypothetical protein
MRQRFEVCHSRCSPGFPAPGEPLNRRRFAPYTDVSINNERR